MLTLRSQAHFQVAPANAKTKTCKRACLPLRTADKKDAAKMKDRITNDKNGQLVTKAKIKRAESANLKGSASNKLHRRLTVKCSEMPASF
jgi:hypothetical protein